MKDLVDSEITNDSHRLDSASLEKTVAYETDDGLFTEKTTLNYKHDSGNVIDKTIDEVRSSEYVKKAGSSAKGAFFGLVKLLLIFGFIGFILLILAIMGGAIQ